MLQFIKKHLEIRILNIITFKMANKEEETPAVEETKTNPETPETKAPEVEEVKPLSANLKELAADIGCGLIFLGDDGGGPYTDCRINFPTPGDGGGGDPALPRLTGYDNLIFTIVNLNANPVTLSIGQGPNHLLPTGVNCSTRATNVITVVTTLKGQANGIAADGGSVTFRIEVVTPLDGATTPLYAETYNLWAY